MISADERWISNYFRRHPRTSLRTAEKFPGLLRISIQHVLWNGLHLLPFRVHTFQEQEERDYEARIEHSHWCLANIELDASFLNSVIISDECGFHAYGKVSIHNVIIWGIGSLHGRRVVSNNCEQVTDWCALENDRVISSFYCDEPVVTGESHLYLYWIQVSSHYYQVCLQILFFNEILPYLIITRQWEIYWIATCQILVLEKQTPSVGKRILLTSLLLTSSCRDIGKQEMKNYMYPFNTVGANSNINYFNDTHRHASKCIAKYAKSLLGCFRENGEHSENRL